MHPISTQTRSTLHTQIRDLLAGRLHVQAPADSNVASEILDLVMTAVTPIAVPTPTQCQHPECRNDDESSFVQNLIGTTRDGRLQEVYRCEECDSVNYGDKEIT